MSVLDGSEVDEALVALFAGDVVLRTLLPDGVFFDIAKGDSERFVLISLTGHADDYGFQPKTTANREEVGTYSVRAVSLDTSSAAQARQAAARIHELLHADPPLLAIEGYHCTEILRQGRIRFTTYDATSDVRWQHRGGTYQITVQPTAAPVT